MWVQKTRFPSPTSAGTSSTTDYEQYTLDAAGNVTSRRLRDGNSIALTFDALNRVTFKNLPGSEPDVTYSYDLLGRMTGASQSGHALSFTWDALGRNLTQVSPLGTVAYQYDLAGRRTRLTYPGTGLYVDYDHLVTGEVTKIRENGASSGVGVLATYAYDDLGRRTSLTRGNGAATTYQYDSASRLAQLVQNPVGTSHDLTLGFGYNPASQIVSNTRSNDAYSLTALANANRTDTHDGLNRILQTGATTITHDARGNVTSDGPSTFSYSSENLLTQIVRAGTTYTLGYDPLMRLASSSGWGGFDHVYDGLEVIETRSGNHGNFRIVHGPGIDEPLVQYDGAGLATRTFFHADERGSIVATSDSTGAVTAVRAYDEYGIVSSGGLAFGFTGQRVVADAGPDTYYYRARFYHARLGRFLQPDPIGYLGGMNLYAYVGNDPVNFVDPLGLGKCLSWSATGCDHVDVALESGRSPQDDPGPLELLAFTTSITLTEGEQQRGDFHFRVQDFAFCSADELFAQFSKPGNSAPGAPAAQPGTTLDIPLTGGNPITQIVDPVARTITNVTQEGHRYHPGFVEIRITPTWFGSAVSIEGRGTGRRALENAIGGRAMFLALSTRATIVCTMGID